MILTGIVSKNYWLILVEDSGPNLLMPNVTLPDKDDFHVLAAVMKAEAKLIIISNGCNAPWATCAHQQSKIVEVS